MTTAIKITWPADCTRPMSEREIMEAVVGEFNPADSCIDSMVMDDTGAVMLIERSTTSDFIWLSLHSWPEDAAAYSLEQGDSFEPVILIRVADNKRATPVKLLGWTESD